MVTSKFKHILSKKKKKIGGFLPKAVSLGVMVISSYAFGMHFAYFEFQSGLVADL